MFVAIVNYPKIKEGQEEAFKSWFKWSNSEFSKVPGFIRRSLMLAEKEGEYACLVEMESKVSLILFPGWNYGRATLCRKTIF